MIVERRRLSRPDRPIVNDKPPCGASVSDAELIDQLASRLNRCGFSNRDPERWHEERNAVVVELRRLAKRLRGERSADRIHAFRS